MVDNASNPNGGTPARRRLPWMGALLMVAAVVGFYLLREHWSHIAGNAAYLILLACPLMHLFGHGHGRGHAHHHPGGDTGRADSRSSREGTF